MKPTLFGAVFITCVLAGSSAQQAKADKPWDWDWGWKGPKKPTLDLTYGSGLLRDKAFSGNFASIGSLELKLGYTRMKGGPSMSIDDKFLYFAGSDNAMSLGGDASDEVGSKMIRIGVGGRGGYAYDFDAIYLYPYNEHTFSLTSIDFAQPPGLTPIQADLLGRYEGASRFGYSAETGLALGVSQLLAVRAGYDLTVINPRVIFWEMTGSYLLAAIGYGALSAFAREIVTASPEWGPIIYALLRGGYSYAFYQAMRGGMNWPFNSEKPLTSEIVKVGVTLTF